MLLPVKYAGFVFRRIGGLEIENGDMEAMDAVFRRIGGLERLNEKQEVEMHVFRRIGGLEI